MNFCTIFYTENLVNECKAEIKREILTLKQYGKIPTLSVIQVGENYSSNIYVKNKLKACEEIDINCQLFHFIENKTTEKILIDTIDKLNKDIKVDAILVQLPLPSHINVKVVLNTISKNKDADGFHAYNVGKLFLNESTIVPCTPFGVLKILKSQNIDIVSKHCVVIGRSNIVGRPMAALMLNESATVTVCHSHTKNLASFCKIADIIISAVGQAKLITADMIKSGCTIIDIGITRDKNNHCCGDVDLESVKCKAGFITPVPGGVGPMTIVTLLENVVNLAKAHINNLTLN